MRFQRGSLSCRSFFLITALNILRSKSIDTYVFVILWTHFVRNGVDSFLESFQFFLFGDMKFFIITFPA